MGGTNYQPLDQNNVVPTIEQTAVLPNQPVNQQYQQAYAPTQEPVYANAGVYPALQAQPVNVVYPTQAQAQPIGAQPVQAQPAPVQQQPGRRRGKCRAWGRKQMQKTECNPEMYATSESTSRAVLPVHGGFIRLLTIDTTYYPEFEPFFTQDEFRETLAEINATLKELGPKYHVFVHGTALVVGIVGCCFAGLAIWGIAYLIMRRRTKRAMKAVVRLLDQKNKDIFAQRGVHWRVGNEAIEIELPSGVVVSHLVPDAVVQVEPYVAVPLATAPQYPGNAVPPAGAQPTYQSAQPVPVAPVIAMQPGLRQEQRLPHQQQ